MNDRKRSPEAEAESLINSSDEGVSDLLDSTSDFEIDLNDEELDALQDTGGDLEVDFDE